MLITSRFVVINLPKSGSSFVRAVIKAIYAQRRGRRWHLRLPWSRSRDRFLRELILPNIRLAGRPADQHGTVAQIPARFRGRPIVAVLRDPYTKMVSEYRFRWWATYPPLDKATLYEAFPTFPDLSFDAFLRLSDHIAAAKAGADNADRMGNLTIEFVQFFFRDPAAALAAMSDDYIRSGTFRQDMAAVEFLRQEDLNRNLAAFLARMGFAADEVARCRAHERVNVTAVEEAGGDDLWTEPALRRFQDRERYLLAMLDSLGFRHVAPILEQGAPRTE
jgi:hypothetical protein